MVVRSFAFFLENYPLKSTLNLKYHIIDCAVNHVKYGFNLYRKLETEQKASLSLGMNH
ncbi:hypothetical protein Hanom_Chr13g01242901 [Helianthus anomalus]